MIHSQTREETEEQRVWGGQGGRGLGEVRIWKHSEGDKGVIEEGVITRKE